MRWRHTWRADIRALLELAACAAGVWVCLRADATLSSTTRTQHSRKRKREHARKQVHDSAERRRVEAAQCAART